MRLREAQVDAESKTARAVQEVADYRDAVRELRSEQRLAWLHLLWLHLLWLHLLQLHLLRPRFLRLHLLLQLHLLWHYY